jgi:hypothetical protein
MQRFANSLFRSAGAPWTHVASDRQKGITEQEIEEGLQALCCPPIETKKFQQISNLIRMLDTRQGRTDSVRTAWHQRPRTYSVLRMINGLALMDLFIQNRYTDLYLPYTDDTLPGFFDDKELRKAFLDTQICVLDTDAQKLELAGARHLRIPGSADIYFRKLRFLGEGGHGYKSQRYDTPKKCG